MVAKTIKSLVDQDYNDYEIIIINDGSTDDTHKILTEYKQMYPQLITIYAQENKGVSAARNLGIARASGEYIAFIDSDDLWISSKLSQQLQFMEENDLKICQTDERWVRNGRFVNPMKKHQKRSGKIFYDCLQLCLVSPSAVMIKKSLFSEVGCFDEYMLAVEDYDLWIRIAARYPIKIYPQQLVTKIGGHEDQLSRTISCLDELRIYSMTKLIRKQSCSIDIFKKRALYWWISAKANIVGIGAYKRKLFIKAIIYKFMSKYYGFRWWIS